MKINNQFFILTLAIIAISFSVKAQEAKQEGPPRQNIGVAAIETKGIAIDAIQMADMCRIALDKTNKFWVVDKFDMRDAADSKNVNIEKCLGRNCNLELGKLIKADKMVTGSVEKLGEKVIVSLRLIDVSTGAIEKTQVEEFLNILPEIQNMLQITVSKMAGIEHDPQLVERLTKITAYESATVNPGTDKVKLDGPRMGMTTFTGEALRRIMDDKKIGGYGAFPVMTQFGYQFETQYLSDGNFQALVEFIPLITGIDQGYFIPSFTLLNGFRNSRNGWEFAFGPSLSFSRKASGYINGNGEWVLVRDHNRIYGDVPITYDIISRLDRRGNPSLTSGFVFAVGKSFKSGRMNIPVNVYVIPGNDSWRLGASFGFNTKNKKANE